MKSYFVISLGAVFYLNLLGMHEYEIFHRKAPQALFDTHFLDPSAKDLVQSARNATSAALQEGDYSAAYYWAFQGASAGDHPCQLTLATLLLQDPSSISGLENSKQEDLELAALGLAYQACTTYKIPSVSELYGEPPIYYYQPQAFKLHQDILERMTVNKLCNVIENKEVSSVAPLLQALEYNPAWIHSENIQRFFSTVARSETNKIITLLKDTQLESFNTLIKNQLPASDLSDSAKILLQARENILGKKNKNNRHQIKMYAAEILKAAALKDDLASLWHYFALDDTPGAERSELLKKALKKGAREDHSAHKNLVDDAIKNIENLAILTLENSEFLLRLYMQGIHGAVDKNEAQAKNVALQIIKNDLQRQKSIALQGRTHPSDEQIIESCALALQTKSPEIEYAPLLKEVAINLLKEYVQQKNMQAFSVLVNCKNFVNTFGSLSYLAGALENFTQLDEQSVAHLVKGRTLFALRTIAARKKDVKFHMSMAKFLYNNQAVLTEPLLADEIEKNLACAQGSDDLKVQEDLIRFYFSHKDYYKKGLEQFHRYMEKFPQEMPAAELSEKESFIGDIFLTCARIAKEYAPASIVVYDFYKRLQPSKITEMIQDGVIADYLYAIWQATSGQQGALFKRYNLQVQKEILSLLEDPSIASDIQILPVYYRAIQIFADVEDPQQLMAWADSAEQIIKTLKTNPSSITIINEFNALYESLMQKGYGWAYIARARRMYHECKETNDGLTNQALIINQYKKILKYCKNAMAAKIPALVDNEKINISLLERQIGFYFAQKEQPDYARAYAYFSRAADKEDVIALYNKAMLYLTGNTKSQPQDALCIGIELLKKATQKRLMADAQPHTLKRADIEEGSTRALKRLAQLFKKGVSYTPECGATLTPELLKDIQKHMLSLIDKVPEWECYRSSFHNILVIDNADKLDDFERGMAHYHTNNYQEAWDCFTKSLEAGNPKAHTFMGHMYLHGLHVPKSEDKALEHYTALLTHASSSTLLITHTELLTAAHQGVKTLAQAGHLPSQLEMLKNIVGVCAKQTEEEFKISMPHLLHELVRTDVLAMQSTDESVKNTIFTSPSAEGIIECLQDKKNLQFIFLLMSYYITRTLAVGLPAPEENPQYWAPFKALETFFRASLIEQNSHSKIIKTVGENVFTSVLHNLTILASRHECVDFDRILGLLHIFGYTSNNKNCSLTRGIEFLEKARNQKDIEASFLLGVFHWAGTEFDSRLQCASKEKIKNYLLEAAVASNEAEAFILLGKLALDTAHKNPKEAETYFKKALALATDNNTAFYLAELYYTYPELLKKHKDISDPNAYTVQLFDGVINKAEKIFIIPSHVYKGCKLIDMLYERSDNDLNLQHIHEISYHLQEAFTHYFLQDETIQQFQTICDSSNLAEHMQKFLHTLNLLSKQDKSYIKYHCQGYYIAGLYNMLLVRRYSHIKISRSLIPQMMEVFTKIVKAKTFRLNEAEEFLKRSISTIQNELIIENPINSFALLGRMLFNEIYTKREAAGKQVVKTDLMQQQCNELRDYLTRGIKIIAERKENVSQYPLFENLLTSFKEQFKNDAHNKLSVQVIEQLEKRLLG